MPASEALVHGDFHPGNVLWPRSTVSGVVDWQATWTGPEVIDVTHCRVNLLTIGTDATERFTAWWQQAAGAAYHPLADVVTIIRVGRRPRATPATPGHAEPGR